MPLLASHVPEVRALELIVRNGRPDGNPLRQFLVQVCARRSVLRLPPQADAAVLTWQDLGLAYSGAPRFQTWRDVLTRLHDVLALPAELFKKSSFSFQ